MAKCDVCGRWAGIFRKRHSDCVPRENAEAFALKLADSLRASLKPMENIEITVSTCPALEVSIVANEKPVIEVASSFDMKTNFSPPPDASAIIDVVRRTTFIGASNQDLIDAVTRITNSGGTDRAFYKWLNENGGCDRFWAEMLFGTLSLAIYSNHHRMQHLEVREFLPYWELSSMTTFCRSHSRLDGLVRRWDDPVWADLYPPNGWMCGCSVLAGAKEDFADAPHIRVTAQIRERCKNWINTDPNVAIDLLRPSPKNR